MASLPSIPRLVCTVGVVSLLAGCPSRGGDSGPDPVAPTSPGIVIGPEAPRTGDDLQLSIAFPSTDADDDFAGYTVSWRRDGEEILDLSDAMLVPADRTAKAEAWSVWVTAFDARGLTSMPSFQEVVIANTSPTPPTLAIEPEEPRPGEDDLVCTIVGEGEDADGDALEYAIAWRLEGGEFTETEMTMREGDTVPAEHVEPLQVWSCAVTSHDGTDASSEMVASIAIGSGLPQVVDFSLPDVNDTSTTFGAVVSPRDYLQKVSGWYFGHAT